MRASQRRTLRSLLRIQAFLDANAKLFATINQSGAPRNLEGGGHQHHKLRIVSFERKQRSDSAAALLDPGEPDVKCPVHQR